MPRLRAVDLVDVLVYVVVLGLFVQFAPAVISESFLVTVVTAVLLKLVLEVVVVVKKRVVGRARAAVTPVRKAVGLAALALVGAGSKLAVLALTDLVLGDRVYLGGFVPVTGLVVTLMAARFLVRRAVSPG